MSLSFDGLIKGMATFLGLALLSACGNVSHSVAKDGRGANELVWPAPESVTPMHKGGTFPTVAQLQLLRYGMNKQQISQLVGYPHFSEGVWSIREWNYVFNFRDEESDHVTVCQFKILFDQDKVAQSFYWKPESCSRYMAVPISPAMTDAPKQTASLSSDALFRFDGASIEDVTNDGKVQLTRIAKDLLAEKDRIKAIRVLGYADRLGNDDYDFSLSERRAYTVMHYLVDQGLSSDLIVAQGLGKSDAVKECPDTARDELIACLAPNRRVVVQVDMLNR